MAVARAKEKLHGKKLKLSDCQQEELRGMYDTGTTRSATSPSFYLSLVRPCTGRLDASVPRPPPRQLDRQGSTNAGHQWFDRTWPEAAVRPRRPRDQSSPVRRSSTRFRAVLNDAALSMTQVQSGIIPTSSPRPNAVSV